MKYKAIADQCGFEINNCSTTSKLCSDYSYSIKAAQWRLWSIMGWRRVRHDRLLLMLKITAQTHHVYVSKGTWSGGIFERLKYIDILWVFSGKAQANVYIKHIGLIDNSLRPSDALNISKLGCHWFRYCLIYCSAPSLYLNQFWFIVSGALGNKPQWNSNQNRRFSF